MIMFWKTVNLNRRNLFWMDVIGKALLGCHLVLELSYVPTQATNPYEKGESVLLC